MPQAITFHGAAETVTGSRHLLEIGKKKVLVDCGLFQGPREIKERNWKPLPFDIGELDAIVLTHAHTDHIGFLPRLARLGWEGPVYCTQGTASLCKISLPDGGRIQEEDAKYHNRHGTSRHRPAEPLFTEADARRALKMLQPIHYHQWQDIPGGAQFRYLPAGHILGSAFAEIYFEDGQRIVMSGDLGRYDRPILKDPAECDFGEYLVVESTYGDRTHEHTDAKEEIYRVMKRAADTRAAVIVPSFAIGRTQELLWHMHELKKEGRLPDMPIYVDSPMATAATLLYVRHDEDHDKEMRIDMDEGKSPFDPGMVRFVRDRSLSKQLNTMRGPMVIIAGSGMISGGRVIHHLKHRLSDPSTILLFTGYQARGTRGRSILEGAERVKIHGADIPIKADIRKLNMLSAHADSDEILRWLGGFKTPPKKTFMVHGEPPAQAALKARIEKELGWDVVIPKMHERFELP
jgi:metallo-beta-lactamase family protein